MKRRIFNNIFFFRYFGLKRLFWRIRPSIRKFDALKVIDSKSKNMIRKRVIFYEYDYIKLNLKYGNTVLLVLLLLGLLIDILGVNLKSLSVEYLMINNVNYRLHNAWTDVSSYVFLSLFLILFVLPIVLDIKKMSERRLKVNLTRSIVFITILIFASLLTNWSKDIYFFINGLIPSMISLDATLLILLLTLIFVLPLISSFIYRLIYARRPMTLLIHNLLLLLYAADSDSSHWPHLNYRRTQLLQIEIVAKYLEDYLPRQLQSGDIVTDTWMKEKTRRFAAALREKKKWLLTPKNDTHDYFAKSIASTFICIINGNWDGLEQADLEKLSIPQLRHTIVLFMLKVLEAAVVAILPAGSIWLLHQMSLTFDQTFQQFLYVGAFIWALLTFIVVLDPNFSTKMSAFKDAVNLLWPSRTGNIK